MKCEFCGVEASVCRICYDNMEQAFSYKIEQIQAENERYKKALEIIVNKEWVNYPFIDNAIYEIKEIAKKALENK